MSDRKITIHTLTELIYAEPEKGASYKLVIYNKQGYHYSPQWFTSGKIRYPQEEITLEQARKRAEPDIARGLEVRIVDGGDFLIAHWIDGKQIYPDPSISIWEKL